MEETSKAERRNAFGEEGGKKICEIMFVAAAGLFGWLVRAWSMYAYYGRHVPDISCMLFHAKHHYHHILL